MLVPVAEAAAIVLVLVRLVLSALLAMVRADSNLQAAVALLWIAAILVRIADGAGATRSLWFVPALVAFAIGLVVRNRPVLRHALEGVWRDPTPVDRDD